MSFYSSNSEVVVQLLISTGIHLPLYCFQEECKREKEENKSQYFVGIYLEVIDCIRAVDYVNDYGQYLIDFFFTLMNKYFPMKPKILTQKRQEAPWLTARIIGCIRKKTRLAQAL